jgi:hypothetical protein
MGEPITTRGTSISGACFAVEVKNGCNAIEATMFLVAAVLAFPSRWKDRLAASPSGW